MGGIALATITYRPMGIFRRSQPNRPAAPPAPGDVGGELAERLRAIAASEAPEDALQPALQAIVEAVGVQAGAICLFDVRYGLLRLATEVGISDEGCRALRSIRQGDARGWELPLQSLRDRRAYLIDAAQGAQHLPALVEAAAAMRSVACVPLSAADTPLGSLVLVALEPRALSEGDIQQLEQPLAQVVRMIQAARRPRAGAAAAAGAPLAGGVIAEPEGMQGEIAARLTERASLAAKLAGRGDEVDRLREALEASGTERARLAGEIEQARRAAERADLLAASLAAAERERTELQMALEVAVGGQARAEAEHDVTRRDVENTLGRERAAAAEETERLRARLVEAEAAQEEMRAALERGETGGREQVRAAEDARLAGEVELEGTRTVLAAAQARHEVLEAEGRRARGEIERLEALERAARGERERAEKELADTRARFDELAAHGTAVEEEIKSLLDTVSALRAELQTLTGERDQLRGALAELRPERDRLGAETVASQETHALLEDALAREREERTQLGAALTVAEQALAAAEERARVTGAEIERLTAERDAACVALVEQRSAPPAAPEAMSIVSVTAPEAAALAPPSPAASGRPAAAPSLRRSVAPSQSAARSAARAASGARRLLAVLDVDPSWGSAAIEGTEIVVVEPAEDAVARLAEMSPTRQVVNLAAPGALATLSALRAAGWDGRFWACIAAPGSARALPLGMIEPVVRPLDPDAVLAVLAGYAVRGTRVVTAGADGDTFMSLRHALTRQGLSVSMAWDGKQAADLFEAVRPEVVVIDLQLPPRHGYDLIVRLADARPVPSLVLVHGDEDDTVTGFTSALARGAPTGRMVPRDRLLADVLGHGEAPPEEKSQKMGSMPHRR